MKKLIAGIFFIFVVMSLASLVHASKVALIVKNVASLNEEHEKRIKDILTEMGQQITLVDKNVNVDYTKFDLIVVAGRPLLSSTQLLDSFVADIPVNNIPTIGIDSVYLDDWGWVKSNGASSLTRSDRQSVTIQEEHPLTEGFNVGQKAYVHLIPGTTTIDIVKGMHKLHTVATADKDGDLGLLAYASPNTQLYDNKIVSSHSAIVYFGVTYPLYWTSEAVSLFKNSVNWLTNDTDQDGIKDYMDNCPSIPNTDQSDIDKDGIGDACDSQDNRPDLIIDSINLPSDITECDDLNLNVVIKNIGFGSATSYTVELEINGVLYDSTINSPLGINQTKKVSFAILGDDICGMYYNDILNVAVKDVQPGDLDNSNNQLTKIFIFSILKMDVDSDGILEFATDQNKNILDGYEVYFDPNNNTNALPIMGNLDGKTDYLIDIGKNGIYDRYWDPDDRILVNVTYNGTDQILIDLNNDGKTDMIYYLSNKTVVCLDKNTPSVGAITVTPSYNGKTWVIFNISADVTDPESGIKENSCEYTLDGNNWNMAQFSNGKCYKNSLTGTIGNSLSINMRVRDRVGNLGLGTVVSRIVDIRPLRITINLDSSSYSPGSTAYVYGEVSYEDSGEKIQNAIVNYYVSNIPGTTTTNGYGKFSFNFKVPSTYGTYVLSIKTSSTFAKGSGSVNVNVPSPPSSQPSSGSSAYKPIVIVETPSNVTAYEGSDSEFFITVRNGDVITLHNVDVTMNLAQFSTDITPKNVTLFSGNSQTFKVSFHVPDKVAGNYISMIEVISDEIVTRKNISISILSIPQKRLPLITATRLIIPDFYFNETAKVGIIITNTGDEGAEANILINTPPQWKTEESYKIFQIGSNITTTVYFGLIPSKEPGVIKFTTSYKSGEKTISFTNSTEVILIIEKEQPKPKSITSRIVQVLSNPKISLITIIAVVVIVIIALWLWMSRDLIRHSRKKKISPYYAKWESKHRKKGGFSRFLL
jgi:hypothetical protein